jgi:hypothetical protein
MVGGSIYLACIDDGYWAKDAGEAFSGYIDDHAEKKRTRWFDMASMPTVVLLSPNTLSPKVEHSRALLALGCFLF